METLPQINLDTDPRVVGDPHPLKLAWFGEPALLYRVKIEDDFYIHILRLAFTPSLIKEAKWKSTDGDPNGGLEDGVFRLRTAWYRYKNM